MEERRGPANISKAYGGETRRDGNEMIDNVERRALEFN